MGQNQKALQAFTQAIRIAPRLPEAWYNFGLLFEEEAQGIKDALMAHQKALTLLPTNQDILDRVTMLDMIVTEVEYESCPERQREIAQSRPRGEVLLPDAGLPVLPPQQSDQIPDLLAHYHV